MTLILVYNATSGKLNALLDAGHKLINPVTYNCSLCKMTHGVLKEKKIWTNFKNEGLASMVFYHKDEFEKEFPEIDVSYPAILTKENDSLKIMINSKVLDSLNSTEELIKTIEMSITSLRTS